MTAPDRIAALTEQLAAARRDAEEAEAYARELEANGLANRVAIMRLEARNARLLEAAACAAVDWVNGDYGMSAEKAADLGIYGFVKRRAALRAGGDG